MYKVQEEGSFEIRTTVTFSCDEANEPSSVTVEGPTLFGNAILGRSAAREFAAAALDTHFGNDDHGYRPSIGNIINEESPEPEGTMTFDVHKSLALRMQQSRGEK